MKIPAEHTSLQGSSSFVLMVLVLIQFTCSRYSG